LKILLAPSETKTDFCDRETINKNSFIFPEMFEARMKVLKAFEEEVDPLIFQKTTAKSMMRYDGVAFDAICYKSLDKNSQNYIDKNTIIFSNIFGPILAGDLVPNYTFKQGSKLSSINIGKHYSDTFCELLDELCGNFVVDLRAGFYEKFYIPKIKTYTFKFMKNGKIVSHWAKYYRGIIVKEMAKNNILTESEFLNLQIDKLSIKNLVVSKNKTIFECEIGD
jgi:cytoplasmic iron level regulating protein YaaA (DUF328/UPF0246 family)